MAKSTRGAPELGNPIASERRVCPECGHTFQGNGWDGIDAHWKAKHAQVMPYDEAWPLIIAGTYRASDAAPKAKRTPEEQRAEIERVARENGADLNEEGFNEALKKVGHRKHD